MKQNSSIMFHGTHKPLTKSYFGWVSTVFSIVLFSASCATAADNPEHPASFDPSKGFKPAQSDLAAVVLQIAGSLECYGSPEPYLRHIKAEHARIEAKYQQQLGDKPRSFCPAYMDAAYFDRFAANWKHIAPQLGLESLTKNTGRLMRMAINGPDGKGTMLLTILDEHQRRVSTAMTNNEPTPVPGFDVLKTDVVKCARLDEPPSPLGTLTAGQQAVIQPADQIRASFLKVFSALDSGLSATDAEKVKTVLLGIVDDVGRMAESEMEVGILEDSFSAPHAPQLSYNATRETGLNADEQKTFAAFMKKPRFTKADFTTLDKFYQRSYDRLREPLINVVIVSGWQSVAGCDGLTCR